VNRLLQHRCSHFDSLARNVVLGLHIVVNEESLSKTRTLNIDSSLWHAWLVLDNGWLDQSSTEQVADSVSLEWSWLASKELGSMCVPSEQPPISVWSVWHSVLAAGASAGELEILSVVANYILFFTLARLTG
jgi:hypothetical protein